MEELSKALTLFEGLCAYCYSNGVTVETHDILDCKMMAPKKNLHDFLHFRYNVRYDTKINNPSRENFICWLCHLPQHLQRSHTNEETCNYKDVALPVIWYLWCTKSELTEAAKAFKVSPVWMDVSEFIAWLVLPAKSKYPSNLLALFVWITQRLSSVFSVRNISDCIRYMS